MELKIFDHDYYKNDFAAQRVEEILRPLCRDIEGLWLYREPEIRTEGNELPTFTLVSPEIGICFIKVFSENSESLTSVENRFWVIDGVKVKSGIQKFRNYSHRIKSKLEDPILDLQVEIPTNTIYVFPYLEPTLFSTLQIKSDEQLYASNFSELVLPFSKKTLTKRTTACWLVWYKMQASSIKHQTFMLMSLPKICLKLSN